MIPPLSAPTLPRSVTLANARLVLPDTVVVGALDIEDGLIAAIRPGTDVPADALDLGGDYLAPGMIELHTDNLERHIEPRPGVAFPRDAAVLAHDAEMAGTGITTLFDALRVGSIHRDEAGHDAYAREVASVILDLRARGQLRISHHLHLRAEICSDTLLDELAQFSPEDRVGLVSLMDHTPGQRQFRDPEKLYDYWRSKGMTQDQIVVYAERLTALRAAHGDAHEAGAVAHARALGARIASHDDTTADQVAHSADLGVVVAEFPTTLEAAEACRAAGIAVMMGTPNLLRGGSHSGNVAARELAEAGCLDILSSDYIPASLLPGAIMLGEIWGDLARGLATVTSAPAQALGFADRGRLEVGLRADLMRFSLREGLAQPLETWVLGARVR